MTPQHGLRFSLLPAQKFPGAPQPLFPESEEAASGLGMSIWRLLYPLHVSYSMMSIHPAGVSRLQKHLQAGCSGDGTGTARCRRGSLLQACPIGAALASSCLGREPERTRALTVGLDHTTLGALQMAIILLVLC